MVKKNYELKTKYMNVIIVNNPKQEGARNGAKAIFTALGRLYPHLSIEIQIVNSINDVTIPPDIVCSVGPDTTHVALQIYDTYNASMMVGMKDPFKTNSPVKMYDKWSFICDTMGTMEGSLVDIARPELVYIPPFPPFSLSKNDLDEARKNSVLRFFSPELLIVVGGADPYTKLDLCEKDVDELLYHGKDYYSMNHGKVAIATSPRTNPDLIALFLAKMPKDGSFALHDFHQKKLFIGDGVLENCTDFYLPAMSVASLIIPTDDSLSMVAEATVPERHVVIYETFNSSCQVSGEVSKRRRAVSGNVGAASGAGGITAHCSQYVEDT